MKTIHVVPFMKNETGSWIIRFAGKGWYAKIERLIYSKKSDAVAEARKHAYKHHVELIIHNRDGQIAQRNSYGNDPVRHKG